MVEDYHVRHPVALIIYQRPDTTARVLDAIRQVRPSRLFVIADGVRTGQDPTRCLAARRVVETIDWDCDVTRIYSVPTVNLGIKQRVESGLEEVFRQSDAAIILEDDCVPHSSFFRYCDDLLDAYADDEQVMSIGGTNFHFGQMQREASYHFSRYSLTWGWATWKRAWQRYDPLMRDWERLRGSDWLQNQLNMGFAVKYWNEVFERNYETLENWDYAWMFTCWLHEALCIVPNINLVQNIGFRADATHTTDRHSKFASVGASPMAFPLTHPPIRERDAAADDITEQNTFSGCALPAMLAAARAYSARMRRHE